MAIVRLDPFRELVAMQDRINRIFGEASRRDDDLFTRGDWMPAVDIYENDTQEVVIKAELPGMKKDEIDLRLENNTLTIRGERKRATDTRDEQYHRVERAYGSFSRSFVLPATVDHNKVGADYSDGILTITLPTKEEAKPRQIQVKVNG